MLKRFLKANKKINWLIFIIIVLVTILYISLIYNDSVWGDEAYTMLMLKNGFIGIIQETANDVHPPLYYLIAKIFTIVFGYSVPVVKFKILFKTQKNPEKAGGGYGYYVTILLIALCPKAFFMNIELRMYTWAMFFVTCSGIYAYELYKRPQDKKTLFFFILTSLCAAYTHYYAVVTECFIYLFLMIALLLQNRKNWKLCLIFVLITIIGYLPWVPVFIKQFMTVKQDYWIANVNLRDNLRIY